jgi:hypothetical protein
MIAETPSVTLTARIHVPEMAVIEPRTLEETGGPARPDSPPPSNHPMSAAKGTARTPSASAYSRFPG